MGPEEFPKSDQAKGTAEPKANKNGTARFPEAGRADAPESGNVEGKLPEEGAIAEDFAAVYPPGIPLIRPGERWTKEKVEALRSALEQGLEVVGLDP